MYLQITKKINDKFKHIVREDKKEDSDEFFSWHADKFVYNRKTGLIIMNNLTRYIVILYDIKKKEIDNLLPLFITQLRVNMEIDHIEKKYIDSFIDDLKEITFSKTNNRSILSQLSDMQLILSYRLPDYDTLKENNLNKLNSDSNDIPMNALKKLGYSSFPNKALKSELEKRYR